jgi:CDGSH-type Zn-finger protein
MRKLFAVAMIGAAVTLAGCGKSNEKTYTDGNGNSVTTSDNGDGHMTITGANGEKVEFGTGANAKMPSDIPLYPGAKVTASFTGNGKDGSGGVVTFTTTDSPDQVIAFYKQKADSIGLAQTMNMDMGGTKTYVAASDKEKRTLSITATKSSDETTGQVTWGTK